VDNRTTLPSALRPRRPVREHEILRVSALLAGNDPEKSANASRAAILKWAAGKTTGALPKEAWNFDSFEHFAGGRNCSAVRLKNEAEDTWVIRVEDPDKGVAQRIWTIEAAVVVAGGNAKFSLRLIVGSPEAWLDVEPAVPSVVRHVISEPGLAVGNFSKLPATPVTIRTDEHFSLLINGLLDPMRKLPIIVLSVPSGAADEFKPAFDARELAKAVAGLALVVILPAKFGWDLTYRFGKRLSVYEGAARVYLPGFTQDANPFGGHELVLPNPEASNTQGLKRLRWVAATGSVRRLELGIDVVSFTQIKLRNLELRKAELASRRGDKKEQITAAYEQIALLEEQVREAEYWQGEFSRLQSQEQERAETAENQLRAAGFRIQQLLAELKAAGASPDQRTRLPEDWNNFIDWCDEQLAGRVLLSPQARDGIHNAQFEDPAAAARCLRWLANEYRDARVEGAGKSLNEWSIEAGIKNAHSGSDEFDFQWQGKTWRVEWHIKNGGNTREPRRCLRIYYFWDDGSQQAVIASMPAHLRSGAS
jgi:hypothetical protein